MVEQARRSRVGDDPRGDPTREWELFVRDEEAEPLRHVGSVTAPDAATAHEQASRLFGWYADHCWVCPADEVRRYSTHDLDDTAHETDDSDDVANEDAGHGNTGDGSPGDGDGATADDRGGGSETPVVDEEETTDDDGDDEHRVTER